MLCIYFNNGRKTKALGRFGSVNSKTCQFKMLSERDRKGSFLSDFQYSKSVASALIIVFIMLESIQKNLVTLP